MTGPVAPVIRLVAGGLIRGTQTWSTGISVAAGPGPYDQTVLTNLLSEFRTRFKTLWGTSTTGALSSRNAAAVDLRTFRGYLYAIPGGPVSLQAAIDDTPVPGASSSFNQPPQCALVASLRTGLPGRSFRGRMYLPFTAGTLGTDGQVPVAACTTIATAVATMLSAINAYTTTGGYGDVVVAGQAGNAPVTSVVVDTEVDIQRRRADKLLPTAYATAAVTP